MSDNRRKLIDFSKLHMPGVEAVAINNNRNNEDKIPASYIRLSDISNVNYQNKLNNSRLFVLSFLLSTILLIICGGLGYSGFFSGSTSSETKGLMNELTKENTAVAESNLKPNVKEEVKSIADNLPEWDENNELYQDFSMFHKDFIVKKAFLGGSISKQTIISDYSELKESIDESSSNYNEESINEIKVDDLDNPKSVITNLENFGNVEYQTWLDGCKKEPDPIGEKVIPIYMLLDGQTKEN